MPRRRIAVALLPPPALAAEVDALRRAVSSSTLATVPPHVTLVPPVNVRADDLDGVRALVRRAAVAVDGLTLDVGPAATFLPDTPTVHLAVRGAGPDDAARLTALRDGLRSGALDRPDTWPYVPHLTLEEASEPTRVEAALLSLGGFRATWVVDRVHLLEQRRPEGATARWVPFDEEPLGPPAVVGRGGVELELRELAMVTDAVAARCGLVPGGPELDPSRPATLVVTAEHPRAGGEGAGPLGAAVGSLATDGTARLAAVAVAPGERGVGIGAQVLRAWCSAAAARGADVVLAGGDDDAAGFLGRHGFGVAGGWSVRVL